MKKITIFALHLAFGGVEKAVTNMANLFVEEYDVEIICTYDMPQAPAYPLDKRVSIKYLMSDIPNKKEFKAAIYKKNPFLIGKEGCKSVKILYNKKHLLIQAVKRIKEGIIISTRHEDTVLINQYKQANVAVIAQLHHDHNFNERLISDFQNHYGNINVFALLNDQLTQEVQEYMKGHNTFTKCITIPNFIEERPNYENHERKHQCIAVGRLDPIKGFDRLIKCMTPILRAYPDWTVQIIGDGEQKEELQKLIEEAHMEEQIYLCGRKSSEEIKSMMLESSCYLMTSYNEGFGIVLIEAMSCGLPSIAFDVRVGPRNILHDQEDGLLIKDQDEQGFREAVEQLIVQKELRETMGKQAYENVYDYTKDHVRNIWFSLLANM